MRKIFWIVLVIILAATIFGKFFVNLLCDWWWYQQVGFENIFLTIWKYKIVLGFIFGILFFIVLWLNLFLAEKFRYKGPKIINDDTLEIFSENIKTRYNKFINKIAVLVLIVISLFVALQVASHWNLFLQFLKAENFNITDPIFNKDIGFFVFKLPFIKFLYYFLYSLLWISFFVILFIYFWSNSIYITRRKVYFTKLSQIHLFIILALIFLFKAISYKLSAYNLLYSDSRIFYGASFTDFYVRLFTFKILIIFSVLCAIISLISAFSPKLKPLVISILALILVSFLGLNVAPAVVQKLIVAPNELNKESRFMSLNIKYTNLAYNLNKVKEKEFPVKENLTRSDIDRNPQIINNIRLWDHKPLLETYRQIQEIRSYYDFVNVDNDRYYVNGEYLQCMLSARELNINQLQNPGWINKHLIYTHGYGLCLGPANKATPEGLPKFFIKNIPPETETNINVNFPQIYYGRLTENYCFVNTKQKEFDYPAGDKNIYCNYQASGVKINSFFKKLIFALRFSEFKILLSTDITNESRILYYRQILERVKKITPLVYYDPNPYLVVSNRKLYWICEGYTITNQYPYSAPISSQMNYVRNSVKVVIDAFTGEMFFYISDLEDPIIKVQSEIFPGLFKPLQDMSVDLKKHIRYPVKMFEIQSKIYSSYHMKDTQVFYNKEDLWKIPFSITKEEEMSPYYTILKFSGSEKEEFILMIPFSPNKKDNMIAWLAARCDFPNYGELIVYKFPKAKLIYGPGQIEARIDQDPEISKQLTLWGQGGSKVIRGSLLVIPIEDSLIYIEPLYLAAEHGQLPELKRVIVASGEKIAMAETLNLALEEIFGNKTASSFTEKSVKKVESSQEFSWKTRVQKAQTYFQSLESAQKQGNWNEYGRNLQKLKQVLEELSRQAEK